MAASTGEEQYLLIRSFTGIDQSYGDFNPNAAGSPDAQNMEARAGSLGTAPGTALYTATPAPKPIGTLMDYHKRNWDGTVSDYLLAGAQGVLYKVADGAFSSLASSMVTDRYSFINYQHNDDDIIIFTNGTSVIQKWDGSASAPSALITKGLNPSSCKHLTLHYERVWAAGDNENLDRVYYSRALNPYDWSVYDATDETDSPKMAGGAIDVPTWDGSIVRAIANLYDDVVIFKDHSIHRIVGAYPGEYEAVRVHGNVGCISPRSIVTVRNAVYFWGQEGICQYDGASAYPLDDARIASFVRGLNQNALDRVCAVCHDNKVLYALPEGKATENNCVLEYDLITKSYMIRRGISVRDFCIYQGQLLFADGTGHIQIYGQGGDWAGQPMECYWKSPKMDLGAKYVTKAITRVYFSGMGEGEGPHLEVAAYSDRKPKPKVRQITFKNTGRIERKGIPIRGRWVRLVIRNINGSRFHLEGGISVTLESDAD